jgi:hypothetical protein
LPHVSMGLRIWLEPLSLPSSLPYLYTLTSVGAEDLAGWRGAWQAVKEALLTFIYSIFGHQRMMRLDKSLEI